MVLYTRRLFMLKYEAARIFFARGSAILLGLDSLQPLPI